MRPLPSPVAAVALLVGLAACGGSRELEPPAPPPTVPVELLHTLKSPVTVITAPGGETPAPGGEPTAPGGELPLAVDGATTAPLPTEVPTLATPAPTDGAEPGPAAVEEPSP